MQYLPIISLIVCLICTLLILTACGSNSGNTIKDGSSPPAAIYAANLMVTSATPIIVDGMTISVPTNLVNVTSCTIVTDYPASTMGFSKTGNCKLTFSTNENGCVVIQFKALDGNQCFLALWQKSAS